jgi:hypothetical protein
MRKSAVVIGILALVLAGGVLLAGPAQAQCAHAAKAEAEKAAKAEKKAGCGGCPSAAKTGGCAEAAKAAAEKAAKAEKKAGCGGCPSAAKTGGCAEAAKVAAAKSAKAGCCGSCAGATGSGGCSHAAAGACQHGAECGHDCTLGKGLAGTFGPAPAVRGVTQKAYPISNGLVIVHQGADPKAVRAARKVAQEKVGVFQATCAAKRAATDGMCGGCVSKLGLLKQAKAEVVETDDGAVVVITSPKSEAVTFLHSVIAQFNERTERASA